VVEVDRLEVAHDDGSYGGRKGRERGRSRPTPLHAAGSRTPEGCTRSPCACTGCVDALPRFGDLCRERLSEDRGQRATVDQRKFGRAAGSSAEDPAVAGGTSMHLPIAAHSRRITQTGVVTCGSPN
jgi:hypothetical protein